MVIRENVTLEQIRAFKPKMIFYGANTCWWTHDPDHLFTTKVTEADIRRTAENLRANSLAKLGPIEPYLERARKAHGRGLPCDPVGGVLFETDDVEGFLSAAEKNFGHYGKHGLRAFMAAHHSNCFAAIYGTPHFASRSWGDYNDALDRLDAQQTSQKGDRPNSQDNGHAALEKETSKIMINGDNDSGIPADAQTDEVTGGGTAPDSNEERSSEAATDDNVGNTAEDGETDPERDPLESDPDTPPFPESGD